MSHFASLRSHLRATVTGLPRPFWFIWAGTFVTRCGSFVLPFLALYLTQGLGLSPSQAGLVIALYGAGGAVAGPLGGFLADHVGRRFTMVTALGLGGAGMIVIGFAHRIEVLAPCIFLLALVAEMYRPSMQAAVSDLIGPADRVRAFGLVYWVINVGVAVGLTVGGLLAARSFYWLFLGDGLTTMVFAFLIWAGVPETRPARALPPGDSLAHAGAAGFFAPYRDSPFVFFLILNFAFALIFMQMASTFALDLTSHGISRGTYGRILAVNAVLIAFVQPFFGPFLARFNRSHTLAAGAVLTGVGFGLNAIASTVPWYVLGVVIWTVGEMAVLPVANALVADLAPTHLRGRYQGAYGLAFGLAVCAAPVIGMTVLDRLGPATLWTGTLVLGLAIAGGHLALARSLTRTRRLRMAEASAGG